MSSDRHTNRQLIAQAVAGDPDALTQLLQQQAPRLRQALRVDNAWLSHLELADVLQITYLDAFLHIRRFDPNQADSFGGWLLQIARNNLRDLQRELAAAKRSPPENPIPLDREQSRSALLATLTGSSATPSRVAASREAETLLTQAIEKLPDDYRAVVQLYDLDGQPVDRVAEHLGRSKGAVYMLRSRAHDRLRAILGTESEFFSDRA
jgi:RNA polymerase sigma-70 factor (ECF subfamily)